MSFISLRFTSLLRRHRRRHQCNHCHHCHCNHHQSNHWEFLSKETQTCLALYLGSKVPNTYFYYLQSSRVTESSQLQVNASKRSSLTMPSGTEAEDTGDELLESAFRSAAMAGPRQRGERKRSQYRHRKSCKYNCIVYLYNCIDPSPADPRSHNIMLFA